MIAEVAMQPKYNETSFSSYTGTSIENNNSTSIQLSYTGDGLSHDGYYSEMYNRLGVVHVSGIIQSGRVARACMIK